MLILVCLFLSVAAAQLNPFSNVNTFNLNAAKKNPIDHNFNFLNNLFRGMFSNRQLQPKDENDQLCAAQLDAFSTALQNISNPSSMWALKMFDAWGKMPSGILYGDSMEIGNFDECLAVKSPPLPNIGQIMGQYCLMTIKLNISLTEFEKLTLIIGSCVPETCTPDFLNAYFNETLNNSLQNSIFSENYCTKNEPIAYEVADYVAIVIFSIIGLLLLGSTIYDVIITYLGRTPNQLLVSFSIVTNSSKLFKINNQRSADVLDCLHGLRCISIIWVVFGHIYLSYGSLPLVNKIEILQFVESYYSMFILEATVSVDTFFVISGLLVAWNVFKELEKMGKLNIPMMYLHRYLRLTPVLAAAILWSASIYKHTGNGPFWKSSISQSNPCEKNWWLNLLYLQNYIRPKEMCIGQSWYLAVDTQLFFLSPLILIPLWKWGKKVLWAVPVLIFLSIGCTFAQFMINNFTIHILDLSTNRAEVMKNTYYPTHTRIGPWLLGLVLGYYLFKNRNRQINIPKYMVVFFWTASIVLMLTILLGPYHAQQITVKPTTLESAFYESLSRISWGLAVVWVIFACTKGYGGLINDFLSNPLWQPLSRIQYSIYISHLLVQMTVLGITRTKNYFSDFSTILLFWEIFGITLCASVAMVLAFESPIIAIEKVIFKRETPSAAPTVVSSRVALTDAECLPANGNENNQILKL